MSQSHSKTKFIKLLVRLLITALSLTWALSQLDYATFKEAVQRADWRFLVLVWFFNTGLFWIRSYRLKLILKKLACEGKVATLFSASAVMSLWGLFMPGMLSLAAKWYVLKRDTGKGSQVLGGMLYNQVSVLLVMVAMGLAALMWTNPLTRVAADSPVTRWIPWVCAGMLGMMLLAFAVLLSPRLGRILDWVYLKGANRLPGITQKRALHFLEQVAVFRTLSPRFHLLIALITFVAGGLGGGCFFGLAAWAAGIELAPLNFVWLFTVIYVLGRIPISAANLGIRESTLIFVLGWFGIDSAAAFLMSMVIFSAQIFMAFIGALCQIYWSLNKNSASHMQG